MLLDQVINGLVSGGLYALIALGYTLVFGVLDKLNFAHTEVFMFGGYVGMVALAASGNLAVAALVVILVTALMGLAIELISFRKFRSSDAQITAALSSLLVGLIIVELTQRTWGTDGKSLGISADIFTAGTRILGVQIAYVKLAILAFALILMAGLLLVIERTRLGRNIRAVSESPDAAQLMGIDITRVTQVTFAIASALAGLSGLMLACKTGVASSDIGFTFGLKALAVMAIGGMGDVRGAMAAGLLVGVAEGLTYEVGLGRLGEMTVWVLMILVLLVRPSGLFGGGRGHSVRA
jgi:branched-chain amino acid transport system permease protein